ncbi:MAG: hypothetical protein FWD05_13825 [Oscillospiraceae bacterium]|nr:hypothetical protein [Oscillospiraceae bacterium]
MEVELNDLLTMHEGFPFSPQTRIAEAITAEAVSITVNDPSVFPEAPNEATLGTDDRGETILYTTKVGNVLGGITRGYDAKNGFGRAKAWDTGTPIACYFTNSKQVIMQENIRRVHKEARTAVDHTAETVANENGAHGIRWNPETLTHQIFNPILEEYVDISRDEPPLPPPQGWVTYGVQIDLNNSNPYTSVTYINDAIGMVSGSSMWDDAPIFKDIRPCVLKNGVRQYYLNPNNFAEKEDGSPANITGDDGDVMIEFPKMAIKIETKEDIIIVQITNDEYAEDRGFKYNAHTRNNQGDRDNVYIGAYESLTVDDKLRSLSGHASEADASSAIFRTRARANGSGYDMLAFYQQVMLQTLYLIRYKNLDSQGAAGRGHVQGGSAVQSLTGALDQAGMFVGSTSTNNQSVKIFGIENLWGGRRTFIDGLRIDSARHITTAFINFNSTGVGYFDLGLGADHNIGGFLTRVQGDTDRGFLPLSDGGSATTHFADFGSLSDGSRFMTMGGDWISTTSAGIFTTNLSSGATGVGGRLMFL